MRTPSFNASSLFALLAVVLAYLPAHAQTNEWTWMDGPKVPQPAVYGTLGTPSPANLPGNRTAPASWTDNNGNLWLFGGSGSDLAGHGGDLNDLWKYDPTTGQWTWVGGSSTLGGAVVPGTLGVPSTANIPAARDGATAWTDAGGDLWLYGGIAGFSFVSLNDLWKFHPATKEWTWVSGNTATTCSYNCNASGVYGTKGVAAPGDRPGSRYGATGWADTAGNLWLFGGVGVDSGTASGYLNDLWKFNIATSQWTWVGGVSTLPASGNSGEAGAPGVYGSMGTPAAGVMPGGRDNATAWTDKQGNLWLFGGSGLDSADNYGILNDLWQYNPSTGQWTWFSGDSTVPAKCLIGYGTCGVSGIYGTRQVLAAQNVPGSRTGAAGMTDSKGNLWLFGGGMGIDAAGKGGYLNDLWEYDITLHQWAWMDGSSTVLCATTWCGQPGVYGTLQTPAFGNSPAGRGFAAAWTDKNGYLWILGGAGVDEANVSTYLQDLWQFQPNTGAASVTATPVITPASGTYATPQTVTISDSTPGATIHYLINGNAPASLYTGPIQVSSALTIQAIAEATGYANSLVSSASFDVHATAAAAPAFSLISGTYATSQTVSLSAATPGSTIFYTTDNTLPTTSSTLYSGPITVSASETILAIAVAANYMASPVASAVYSIGASTTLGEWTWMGGSTLGDQPGIYGTLRTPAPGNIPGGRSSAASWTDSKGNLWLFGGTPVLSGISEFNDLWKFDPTISQWTWMAGSNALPNCGSIYGCGISGVYGTLGTPSATNTPGARSSAAHWIDSKDRLWLFGGYGYNSSGQLAMLNDLWQFDPSINQWTWMGGNSKFILNTSGSYTAAGIYGAPGTYAPGNIPGSRYDASSWVDAGGNFWLFGGYGSDANASSVLLNDMWEFSPTTNQWRWVAGSNAVPILSGYQPGVYGTQSVAADANTPGSRSKAANWADNSGNLWLFGGGGGSSQGQFNDLWTFNPSTSRWTWVSGASKPNCPPDPLIGFNVCTIEPATYGVLGLPASTNTPAGGSGFGNWTDQNGNLWLFGGSASDVTGENNGFYQGLTNTLWSYRPGSSQWAWMNGDAATSNCSYVIFYPIPDVVCFGSQSVYGTQGLPAIGNAPSSRTGAVSWTDKNGNFWLFSGRATPLARSGYTTAMNDLWMYRPSVNTLPPAATPVFSLLSGTYFTGGPLILSNGMPSASIYYTNDGTAPTTASKLYSGPIYISSTQRIRAIATAPGYRNSGEGSASYSFATGTPPNTPVISLASGTYNAVQTVTISDTTPGTTIYYTTDGTAPITTSPVYNGALTIATSQTVTALAVTSVSGYGVYQGIALSESGYVVSAPATATYVIALPTTTPTVTVQTSSTTTTAQALTVSVTVSGGVGKATAIGSVQLASGSYTSASAALSNGYAAITIPAGSLAVGTDILTATYTPTPGGGSPYNSATGAATITVTTPPPPSFTMSATSVDVTAGATANNASTITVTPSGGFTGSVTLAAAFTTIPAGATRLPTFSFGSTNPVNVSGASSKTATLTITTTAQTTAMIDSKHKGTPWLPAGGATLAGLLLFGMSARRRKWRTILGTLALLLAVAGSGLGCGSSGGATTGGTIIPGTNVGVYIITVTGTSGSATVINTVNLIVR